MIHLRWALALGVLAALLPAVAFAHGFGERYTLPVPLWLYLWGAAAAVVLSFLFVGLFTGERGASSDVSYPRYDLFRIGWIRSAALSPWLLWPLRLVGVAGLLLVLVAGLFGVQNPASNVVPTLVWVLWWVGMGLVVVLLGNVWEIMNPWKVLHQLAEGVARRLGAEDLSLGLPYPRWLGVWPAAALLFAFAWAELVYDNAADPVSLALLALLYSLATWTGMIIFGRETWLRHGELFSIYFGILARLAPTEAGRDGQRRALYIRPPAAGLLGSRALGFDELVFVLLMLASVSFDGFLATPRWVETVKLFSSLGVESYNLVQTAGLLAAPLFFGLAYLDAVSLAARFARAAVGLSTLVLAFVYSLVPIAFAYNMAHYYPFLILQGQNLIGLASDPLGLGWDLFGTASYKPNLGILPAAFIWYSEVGLIILGHVLAVYVAHLLAIRLLGNRGQALRSQLPILALMVLYTVSSLWIISQPIAIEQ